MSFNTLCLMCMLFFSCDIFFAIAFCPFTRRFIHFVDTIVPVMGEGDHISAFFSYWGINVIFAMTACVLAFIFGVSFYCFFPSNDNGHHITVMSFQLLFFTDLFSFPKKDKVAGSGIPEVQGYLNGVRVPGTVNLKTFVGKVSSLIFSFSSCLALGPEVRIQHMSTIIRRTIVTLFSIHGLL